MKALAFVLPLAMTLIAGNAHALVKPVGTFVPQQCGEQVTTGDDAIDAQAIVGGIKEVCVGSIVGETDSAVQFRFDDGDSRVYNVTHRANLLMALRSGDLKSVYYLQSKEGEQAVMKVLHTHDGVVKALSGKVQEVPFTVPKLEMVFTIQ